ncbi:MAG: conjugal transfer protein TraB [Deltaproteobacteria bacterium RIFOXYD12_FULL_57_12]|nr:MAG: conjugal transfer protein TraB [Deltaproteobacteria bacterium RIFOXYD12_FULL_57_12]
MEIDVEQEDRVVHGNSGTSADIHRLQLGGREIILVGTAHISRQSVDLVREVIAAVQPDCVCVELDERRYQALADRHRFAAQDLKEVIRKKQMSPLLVNLILAAYQKKLGGQLGVVPGAEMLAAVRQAEEKGIPVALCDRDVRVTLRRAWHATSFWRKGYLLAALISSLFEEVEMSEEKLAALRQQDVLSELLNELGSLMPGLKKVLIDERDIYLAEKIKASVGQRLLAVVGAGHVEGLKRRLVEEHGACLSDLEDIPPMPGYWQAVGWAMPVAIVGAFLYIGWHKGSAVAGASLLFWVLANGIPAAVGAFIALAHPVTVAGAFLVAPITSLIPVLGAGHVTAFIQVMMRPPQVIEFETVVADMASLRGWWHNKLLKVFLAFLLPGLGGMIGIWIGGYEIFSNMWR